MHDDALQHQLEAARYILAETKRKDAEQRARTCTNTEGPVWQEGQMVLVYREILKKGLSQKFIPNWAGPFRVVQRISPVTYLIDLANGRSQPYHVSRLHPFCPTSHPLTSHLTSIDLFDIDHPLEYEDPAPRMTLPTTKVKPGQMLLVLVGDALRPCKVTSITDEEIFGAGSSALVVHLFDTLEFGSASLDPDRWKQAWFPVYLTPDAGQVVRKESDAGDLTPAEAHISHGDILDVPFSLSSRNLLNFAQRRAIDAWIDSDPLSPSNVGC
jgi:hypothetical protein